MNKKILFFMIIHINFILIQASDSKQSSSIHKAIHVIETISHSLAPKESNSEASREFTNNTSFSCCCCCELMSSTSWSSKKSEEHSSKNNTAHLQEDIILDEKDLDPRLIKKSRKRIRSAADTTTEPNKDAVV
jgi:hypothetical protein